MLTQDYLNNIHIIALARLLYLEVNKAYQPQKLFMSQKLKKLYYNSGKHIPGHPSH